jgi:hypothetical protein
MSTYGGRPEDRYGQPSDPWGQPERWDTGYDNPEYHGPEYHGTEYHNPEYQGTEYRTGYGGFGQDPEPAPPARSSTKLVATIVAVLAVLLVGGAVTAFVVTRGDSDKPTAQATPTAGSAGAAAAGAEPGTPPGHSGTPAPGSSAEARFAVPGQCLVNDGTEAQPTMRVVACGPNTYQVLARFDGTIDYAGKCSTVKGYKYHYFFDAELNSLDFLLCLKKR